MSSTTPTTSPNALRRTVLLYLAVGIACLLLSACLLGVMALLVISGTEAGSVGVLCPGAIGSLSGIFGFLLLLVFAASYGQIAEVDSLLSGKTAIANWHYTVDENNQPKNGYAYIGAKGVYKDGAYYWFVGRSRQLVKVEYEEATPPRLRFVYATLSRTTSRSSGSSTQYNNLLVPIPPGSEAAARHVVEAMGQKAT